MRARWLWVLAAFVVPVVVLGVPYLSVTYSQLRYSGVVGWYGTLVLGATALAARLLGRVSLPLAIVVPVAALLSVVAARIVMDVSVDPTDHNLWPFEIVIAAGSGGFGSALGGLAGSIPEWLKTWSRR